MPYVCGKRFFPKGLTSSADVARLIAMNTHTPTETIKTRIAGQKQLNIIRTAAATDGEVIYHGWAWKVISVTSNSNGVYVTMERELDPLAASTFGLRRPSDLFPSKLHNALESVLGE